MPSITAVIFAAGRGTRLLPITETLPKPLVPILDVPLIDLALSAVRAVTDDIIVNVSHLSEILSQHLAPTGVRISDEGDEPYGTGGTLFGLRKQLADTVVTYNCDLVSDLDVRALLEAHRRAGTAATLACARVKERADFIDDESRVTLVDRRVRSVPGYRFIGTACFERPALETIPDQRPLGLTEGLIGPLLDGGEVTLFEHPGYAADAGTLTDLVEISTDALMGRFRLDHPGRVIARASMPAYLGPGAQAPEDALGPGAIVSANASVADGAYVANTVVLPGEKVPLIRLGSAVFHGGQALPVRDLEVEGMIPP